MVLCGTPGVPREPAQEREGTLGISAPFPRDFGTRAPGARTRGRQQRPAAGGAFCCSPGGQRKPWSTPHSAGDVVTGDRSAVLRSVLIAAARGAARKLRGERQVAQVREAPQVTGRCTRAVVNAWTAERRTAVREKRDNGL
eukprot:ctg_1005.g394